MGTARINFWRMIPIYFLYLFTDLIRGSFIQVVSWEGWGTLERRKEKALK
jgi:hypothetical protein